MPVSGLGLAKMVHDIGADNFFILHDEEEVATFRHYQNDRLVENVYYIRHPKIARTNILIPAFAYHRHIIREQVSEIVSYIRSVAPVKRLRVSITDEAGVSVSAQAVLEKLPVEGTASVTFASEHEVIIDCKAPLQEAEKRSEYIWLPHFESLQTAVAGVRNGTVTVRESYDFKAALSAKVSDKIGAQGNLNRKHNYQVECEFA